MPNFPAFFSHPPLEDGYDIRHDQYPAPELPFDPDLGGAELNEVRILRSYQASMNATWQVFQRLYNVP